jgi:alpha-glucosidase (family GH31 glycosyl hydrolase)
MKITVTESQPQPNERPYPKFRKYHNWATILFFTSPTVGIVAKNAIAQPIGFFRNDWNENEFIDCDQDGNPLPPLDQVVWSFPKLMKSQGGSLVLFSEPENGVLLKINNDTTNSPKYGRFYDGWEMQKFTDFHGTITIHQS